MKKVNLFRRLGISLLFLAAFYTTISSISNITFADIQALIDEKTHMAITVDKAALAPKARQITLNDKELNSSHREKRYISSEQIKGAVKFEEAINVKQYPSTTVVATGYTAGVESTGKTPDHPEYGITYSGVEVKRDLYSTIAADLTVYPIGTIMYIPDYGYGVVADKGGAIKGNKIDLYYQTVEEVYADWGKKEVQVYIIERGNGKITEEQLVKLNENEALQVFRNQILSKE